MAPRKRQRLILIALIELGERATTKQIAKRAGLNVNGVSQNLGVMDKYVERLGGRGSKTTWRLKVNVPYAPILHGEVMIKAKMVLHHDDPPCTARLDENGYCPKCNLTPDIQNTRLYPYCPTCNLSLKEMKCPNCKWMFRNPS